MKGPGVAWVPVEAFVEGRGWRVSIVWEDEYGHYPTGDWPNDGTGREPWWVPGPSYEEAEAQVCALNEARGVSRDEQARVLLSSLSAGSRARTRAGRARSTRRAA